MRRYRSRLAGTLARLAVSLCSCAPCAPLFEHCGGFFSWKARFVERNRLWVAIKNFPAIILSVSWNLILRLCGNRLASQRGRQLPIWCAPNSLSVRRNPLERARDTLLSARHSWQTSAIADPKIGHGICELIFRHRITAVRSPAPDDSRC